MGSVDVEAWSWAGTHQSKTNWSCLRATASEAKTLRQPLLIPANCGLQSHSTCAILPSGHAYRPFRAHILSPPLPSQATCSEIDRRLQSLGPAAEPAVLLPIYSQLASERQSLIFDPVRAASPPPPPLPTLPPQYSIRHT